MFEDVEEVRPDGEQPLHFYYNREDRIARAPQNVKDFYAGKMKTPRGIRVLFNKQNRYIFFALVIVAAFVWVNNGTTRLRKYAQIAGINVEATAFSYEEEVYVSVQFKRSKNSKDSSPKMINAEIKVIDPNLNVGDVQKHSIIYNEGEQYIRTKFSDYDIVRVDIALICDGETKEISAEVKR